MLLFDSYDFRNDKESNNKREEEVEKKKHTHSTLSTDFGITKCYSLKLFAVFTGLIRTFN